MLLNALVHRNYLGSSVVQIRMFDNSFNIWSEGNYLMVLVWIRSNANIHLVQEIY